MNSQNHWILEKVFQLKAKTNKSNSTWPFFCTSSKNHSTYPHIRGGCGGVVGAWQLFQKCQTTTESYQGLRPSYFLPLLLWVLWKCLFLPLASWDWLLKMVRVCQLLVQSEHVYVLSALCGSQALWGTGSDTLLPVTWQEVMLLIRGRFTYFKSVTIPKGTES